MDDPAAGGRHARIAASVPSLDGLVALLRPRAQRSRRAPRVEPTRAQAIERARRHADELIERAERLGALADDLVEETEFGFLFNAERQLFSIGFNVSDGRLDNSYYDMLASEARLASFMAIATGTISHEHWFKLGRSLTPTGCSRALLSWSASMFEYLMPLLVMRAYPGTLLDETYNAVVERQIQYGAQRGVPWGISESAYYAQDLERNYQYRAFGVPGLGLKRGLADDLVVAPYASILAAPLAPPDVLDNLERLRAGGLLRPLRLLRGDRLHARARAARTAEGGVVLRDLDGPPPGHEPARARQPAERRRRCSERFHADPRVQAADLLLQERIPQLVPLKNPPVETAEHVPFVRRAVGAAGAALHDAAHAQPARAPALERLLHGDGDQRRRRLQPAAAPGA